MTEKVRVTAKFKPLSDYDKMPFSTSSLLKVQMSNGSIVWERHYGPFVDILYHLQGSINYQCSNLDIDCTIMGIVSENSSNSQYFAKRTFQFGPIIQQAPFSSQNQQTCYGAKIQSSYGNLNKCEMVFEGDHLKILPRKDLGALTQVLVDIEDLSSCYIEKSEIDCNESYVIFPYLYQRIVCLKIFNTIVSKGSYSNNQEHLKILICENYSNNKSAQSELQRFLKKINHLKRNTMRRLSQSSLRMSKKPKHSMISTNIQKSMSDFRQDSQDSFRFSKKKYDSLKLKHCESQKQYFPITNAFSQKNKICTLQDSVNYFTEFQNLIFEQDQEQKAQVLLLSDSFDELEKNQPQQKQIEKLQIIKMQRMKRKSNYNGEVQDLKIRLINLKKEKKTLMSTNTKIKQDINRLQEGKGKDFSLALSKASKYLEHLKLEYRMLCTKRRKYPKLSHVGSQKMISKGLYF